MSKTQIIVIIVCICTALGLGILIGSGALQKNAEPETETEKPTEEAVLTPSKEPSPSPKATPVPTVSSTPTPTAVPTPEQPVTFAVKRVVRANSPYGSVECTYDPEDGRLTKKVEEGRLEFAFRGITDYKKTVTYEYTNGIKSFNEYSVCYDMDGNETSSGMICRGEDGMGGVLETYFDGIITLCYGGCRPMSLDFCLTNGEWNWDLDDRGRVSAMYFLKADDRFSRLTYDQDGNLVKRVDYDPNGEEMRRCEFTYNDFGKLSTARNWGAGEQDINYITYMYSADGRLQTGTFYRKGGKVAVEKQFIYDKDGDVIEIRMKYEGRNEAEVITYEYETVNVTEEYLTNYERKKIGLNYDSDWVFERTFVIDPYLWQVFSDIGSVY
ncbi:MAG: hypothetical protein IJL03_04090 [Lachnospiraceae bacterium]|nr:hypothetical protein [Lachnospiraceae bacterium]